MSARGELKDSLPCRHPNLANQVGAVVSMLEAIPQDAPELLQAHGVAESTYPDMLRAAVERMRGKGAATPTAKRRFIEAVLEYGRQQGVIRSWEFTAGGGRNDYKVVMPSGMQIAIEAKGGPDGNNTTIWDRPGWADQFVIWHQSPDSLVNQPGRNMWAGISTRLMPHIASTGKVVDAVIFWDGRCGSESRRCPKQYGIEGIGLRTRATDIPGQDGREWLPPPCIYLMPRTVPRAGTNERPASHTLATMPFAKALLDLFNVPDADQPGYVHQAEVRMRNATAGPEMKPLIRSRAWPDGDERIVETNFKPVKRE